jgi:hypothetical protein
MRGIVLVELVSLAPVGGKEGVGDGIVVFGIRYRVY